VYHVLILFFWIIRATFPSRLLCSHCWRCNPLLGLASRTRDFEIFFLNHHSYLPLIFSLRCRQGIFFFSFKDEVPLLQTRSLFPQFRCVSLLPPGLSSNHGLPATAQRQKSASLLLCKARKKCVLPFRSFPFKQPHPCRDPPSSSAQLFSGGLASYLPPGVPCKHGIVS